MSIIFLEILLPVGFVWWFQGKCVWPLMLTRELGKRNKWLKEFPPPPSRVEESSEWESLIKRKLRFVAEVKKYTDKNILDDSY